MKQLLKAILSALSRVDLNKLAREVREAEMNNTGLPL
jgi:hypothetical protein